MPENQRGQKHGQHIDTDHPHPKKIRTGVGGGVDHDRSTVALDRIVGASVAEVQVLGQGIQATATGEQHRGIIRGRYGIHRVGTAPRCELHGEVDAIGTQGVAGIDGDGRHVEGDDIGCIDIGQILGSPYRTVRLRNRRTRKHVSVRVKHPSAGVGVGDCVNKVRKGIEKN